MHVHKTDKRPNLLLIVADDLGYSDIGCYGGEIHTPNIDRLAKEGVLFTDFHSAAACSPTRSMLLSGTDNHIAGVGCMSEARCDQPRRWVNRPGHEGYLNFDVVALPELLHEQGYMTFMSGKWHLGLRPDNNPAARGFERSFALLPGCTNHWGFEPQWQEQKSDFWGRTPVLYTEDGKKRHVIPNTTDDYDKGFYSTEYYTKNMLRYFHERTESDSQKPFFAYLPFSAPHWPLQCAAEDRNKYQGVYKDGPAALRLKRLEALMKKGFVEDGVVPHDVVAPGMKEWEEMTPRERDLTSSAMEVYAGMVECIDRNIGKVLTYLEETGELENTMVLFLSDNGAEGAYTEAKPFLHGSTLNELIDKYYNNKHINLGNHDSFIWYGPRWAQAATAPSRLYKMHSTEGGIRVPMVARYPKLFGKPGQVVKSFATVMDIMPTFLELAGVKHPAEGMKGREQAAWRDRVVYPMRGKSWVEFFESGGDDKDVDAIHGSDHFMGWELQGHAAARKGFWKITYVPLSPAMGGTGEWELYNLQTDPGETNDLATKQPEKLKELIEYFDKYCHETGAVWGPPRYPGEHDGVSLGRPPPGSLGGDPIEDVKGWMLDPTWRGPDLKGTELNGRFGNGVKDVVSGEVRGKSEFRRLGVRMGVEEWEDGEGMIWS